MKYSSVEWTAMERPADETVAKMFFANVVLPDPGTARFMRMVLIAHLLYYMHVKKRNACEVGV